MNNNIIHEQQYKRVESSGPEYMEKLQQSCNLVFKGPDAEKIIKNLLVFSNYGRANIIDNKELNSYYQGRQSIIDHLDYLLNTDFSFEEDQEDQKEIG